MGRHRQDRLNQKRKVRSTPASRAKKAAEQKRKGRDESLLGVFRHKRALQSGDPTAGKTVIGGPKKKKRK